MAQDTVDESQHSEDGNKLEWNSCIHRGTREQPCPRGVTLALSDLVEGSEQLLGLPAADAELAEHRGPSQVRAMGNRCATS